MRSSFKSSALFVLAIIGLVCTLFASSPTRAADLASFESRRDSGGGIVLISELIDSSTVSSFSAIGLDEANDAARTSENMISTDATKNMSDLEKAWSDYVEAYLSYREAMEAHEETLKLKELEEKLSDAKDRYQEFTGRSPDFPPAGLDGQGATISGGGGRESSADKAGLARLIEEKKAELHSTLSKTESCRDIMASHLKEVEILKTESERAGFNIAKRTSNLFKLHKLEGKLETDRERLKTLELLENHIRHELARLSESLK
jgi:hypothetical protein